ncbi:MULTISPECIES: SURF1 family protein [Candidatus Ichthyocystis]|uniref:SURF1-like protein n=1 Tax=Candidatus Ichthyocystis hellenicum TaxID=1561003 RepID=A0A0S4M296_9BURK|nr:MULTISPECIES: SURF1 family cytochrome oxidase biogenesis protein [Ichthyocystis]CUT17010.1 putative cytochrome c oxidase biogenesis protein, SURF1 family [Candidatus Ichthyocystis hellenicum]
MVTDYSGDMWRNFFFITKLTVVFISLCASAAIWQNYRYHYKKLIVNRIEQQNENASKGYYPSYSSISSAEREFKLVSSKGSYLPEKWFFWEAPTQEGRRIYVFMVPFVIKETGRIVMIDMGWIPVNDAFYSSTQACLNAVRKDLLNKSDVFGVARRLPPKKWFLPTISSHDGRVWSWVDLSRISKNFSHPMDYWQIVVNRLGYPCLNFDDKRQQPEVYPDRHLGYVYQWLTFLIFSLVFYVRYAYKFFSSVNKKTSVSDH